MCGKILFCGYYFGLSIEVCHVGTEFCDAVHLSVSPSLINLSGS